MLAWGSIDAQCNLSGYTFLGKFNGHSYYLSDVPSTWTRARESAAALGGSLAVIGDSEENRWLAEALGGRTAWIGLSDESVEGQFVWANGERTDFANWAAGEPNNEFNEDYVQINRFGFGQWNDMPAWVGDLPGAIEFGDSDCDGITDECDICSGGDDNGPCNASVFPGVQAIPAAWRCDPSGNYVYVCRNGITACLAYSELKLNPGAGDFLGPCSGCGSKTGIRASRHLVVEAFPNPVTYQVDLAVRGIDRTAIILIYDLWGRVIYRKTVEADEYIVKLSPDRFAPGDHYVRVASGNQTVFQKLLIGR